LTIKFPVSEDRPWFKGNFWPEGVPHQLDYDYSLSIPQMLEQSANNYADFPAIWFLDTWVTYKELKDMVDRFATSLSKLGIKKGDVVALLMPNCIQYVVSYYAIATLGAISTGVNPTYKPLEILHQLKLTGAKSLIVLDVLYSTAVSKIVNEWDFNHVIYTNLVDQAVGLSKLKIWLGKKLKKIPTGTVNHPKAISFLKCLDASINLPFVLIDAENDTNTLMMTGGTTGVPKAAELTHQNCVANAMQAKETLVNQRDPENNTNLGHKSAMIGVLPLFHSFAMSCVMNAPICSGAYMLLFPIPPPAEELLKTVCKLPNYNGFAYPGAEILFQRMAELPESTIAKYDIKDRFKLCLSAAGPLHDYVRIPFEKKTGAQLTELYGLSEASPGVSGNNFFGLRESGYIGVPISGTDWDIFPIEDFSKGPINKVGEDGIGEICVCGPQVMKGYWQNPERTAATIKDWDGRKWLLTGDIGFMDEQGRIKIKDRKKQLIKMSGHSVFPAEVESLIGQHKSVLEVAVAGLPDPKTGEAVKAWVVLEPEAKGKITADEIKTWAMANLTKWKCPKYIDIIDEIPKNIIGKVQRRTLQEADPLFKKN
jgi:long-chain acyl-CoA synthetase